MSRWGEEYDKMARRLLLGMLLAISALALGFTIARPGPWIPAVRDGVTVSPEPNPTHVEWNQYPVGGMWLARPEPDSLGRHATVTIPEGSVLLVPHLVEGEDPDSIRTES
jgi:hypothetical protein